MLERALAFGALLALLLGGALLLQEDGNVAPEAPPQPPSDPGGAEPPSLLPPLLDPGRASPPPTSAPVSPGGEAAPPPPEENPRSGLLGGLLGASQDEGGPTGEDAPGDA